MQFIKYGSKIFGLSYIRKRIYLYHKNKESLKRAHTMMLHLTPVNVSNQQRTQHKGSAVLALPIYFL
jgi:hypothetical protein